MESHEPHVGEPAMFSPPHEALNNATGYREPFSLKEDRRSQALPELSVRDRLQYLEALYPYGAYDDLMNVIMATEDADSAARMAYEVLNPDIYGLPYLKEQHELRNNSKLPPCDRFNAFMGISELLEERAADLLRKGQFEGLSQLREYNRTVRTFAVDTSSWDAKFLTCDKNFSAFSQQHLPLTEEERTRLPSSKRPAARGPTADSDCRVSPRLPDKRTGLPSSARRYLSSGGGDSDSVCTVDDAPGARGPHVKTSPVSVSATSGASGAVGPFDSFVEDIGEAPPVAPIVRWAPKALRVGPAEAQQRQEDIFNIFDAATFFDLPLLSRGGSSPAGRGSPPSPVGLKAARQPSAQAASTQQRKTENHEPDAESLADGEEAVVVLSETLARPTRSSRTANGADPHPTTATGNTGGDSGSLGPDEEEDEDENEYTLPPNAHNQMRGPNAYDHDGSDADLEVVTSCEDVPLPCGKDPNIVSPRTAVKLTLSQRKQRHEPPTRLQKRVKQLKPLNYVFEQSTEEKSAQTATGTVGPASQHARHLDKGDRSRQQHAWRGVDDVERQLPALPDELQSARYHLLSENHTPYGGILREDELEDGSNETGDPTNAEDPFMFLNAEEERWGTVDGLLRPYQDIFDSRGRCYVVKQIVEKCPAFVEELTNVTRSLLYVVGKEFSGRKVSDGLTETPTSFPFFRNKLLSTSAFVVKTLEFQLDKCTAAPDRKDPSYLHIKAKVKRLELEPVHFAYIDQTEAAKQTYAAWEARKQVDRRKDNGQLRESVYENGYTNGTLYIKLKDVSFSAVATAALLMSGSMATQIEKTSLHIGTLGLSTDVKKLNVFFTVCKPIVKAVVTSLVEGAIVGQHSK